MQAFDVAMLHVVEVLSEAAIDLHLNLSQLVKPAGGILFVGDVVFENLGDGELVEVVSEERKSAVHLEQGAIDVKLSYNIRVSHVALLGGDLVSAVAGMQPRCGALQ